MIQNLKNGVAVQGYDVVSYFDNNPQMGNPTYTVIYKDAKYQFSSQANKTKFEASPEAFIPQYGGYCPIAMCQGKEVIPNPKSYEIRDGKLYFFTRMLFGLIDAKKQWAKDTATKQTLANTAWSNINSLKS
jgi:YHS domain-containing protein